MRIFLTKKQADLVLESLTYTKFRIREHEGYPAPELRQKHLDETDEVIERINKAQEKGD